MTPEETNLVDPNDDDRGRKNRRGDLPKLRPATPRLSGDEPSSAPLVLADLEPELAKQALVLPFEAARSLYPEVDGEEAFGLVSATIDRVTKRKDLKSEEAISVSELAAVADLEEDVEHCLSPLLTEFGQAVTRGTYAQVGERVFFEQFESHRSTTGRRHNGEGSEKAPEIGRNQLHMLEHSLAGRNRHCPVEGVPLNMGTRWARSCERFGADFPAWAWERVEEFPDRFAEYLDDMLKRDRGVRRRVLHGLKADRVALAGNLTAANLLAAISKYLLIGPVPFGTSFLPHRAHHDVFPPGLDAATIEVVGASSRSTALACGPLSPEDMLTFEEESESLEADELPSMSELEISHNPGVRYRWSPPHNQLARYVVGKGARADLWRLVGVEREVDFWRTVAMIERHAQVTWPRECIDRYEADCMPGQVQVHLPEQCAGIRALLGMANSGMVHALRQAG